MQTWWPWGHNFTILWKQPSYFLIYFVLVTTETSQINLTFDLGNNLAKEELEFHPCLKQRQFSEARRADGDCLLDPLATEVSAF